MNRKCDRKDRSEHPCSQGVTHYYLHTTKQPTAKILPTETRYSVRGLKILHPTTNKRRLMDALENDQQCPSLLALPPSLVSCPTTTTLVTHSYIIKHPGTTTTLVTHICMSSIYKLVGREPAKKNARLLEKRRVKHVSRSRVAISHAEENGANVQNLRVGGNQANHQQVVEDTTTRRRLLIVWSTIFRTKKFLAIVAQNEKG